MSCVAAPPSVVTSRASLRSLGHCAACAPKCRNSGVRGAADRYRCPRRALCFRPQGTRTGPDRNPTVEISVRMRAAAGPQRSLVDIKPTLGLRPWRCRGPEIAGLQAVLSSGCDVRGKSTWSSPPATIGLRRSRPRLLRSRLLSAKCVRHRSDRSLRTAAVRARCPQWEGTSGNSTGRRLERVARLKRAGFTK